MMRISNITRIPLLPFINMLTSLPIPLCCNLPQTTVLFLISLMSSFQKYSTNEVTKYAIFCNWLHEVLEIYSSYCVHQWSDPFVFLCSSPWYGCITLLLLFFNLFFYWRIVALQNFVVFCQTSTWISHRYTYIPSL